MKQDVRKPERRPALVSWISALVLVSAWSIASPASAATYWWNGAGTLWTSTSSWSTSASAATPNPASPVGGSGGTDDFVFNISSLNSAQTVYTGTNRTVNSLTFNSSDSTTILSGTATTSGTQGINLARNLTVSAGAGAVTIGNSANPVAVNLNSQYTLYTLTNNSSSTLTFGSPFTRSGFSAVQLAGAGAIVVTSATNTNGLLGPWITTGSGNSTQYVTVGSSGTLNAYSSGIAAASAAGVTLTGGTANYDVAAGGLVGAGASVNTIRYTGPADTISGALTTNGLMNAGTGLVTFNGNIAIGASNLIVSTPTAMALSGVVSGASLMKTGTATLELSGNNTYTGAVTILAGALRVSNANALGTTSGTTTVGLNAALELSGGIAVGAEPLTLNGSNTGIDNGGALRNISGNNSFAGNITFGNSGGRINSDSGTLTLSGSVGTGGTSFTLGGNGNIAITGPINISNRDVTKDGLGTAVLSGTNTYTGLTSVSANGGVLQFAKTVSLYNGGTASWVKGNVSASTGITVNSGGTLAVNVGGTGEFDAGQVNTLLAGIGGTVSNNGLRAGSAIGFDTTNATGGTFTLTGTVADTAGTGGGAVGLVKLGSGELVLSATNTFSGAANVAAGVLSFGGTNALRNTAGVNLAGGAGLTYTGGATAFAKNVTVTAGSGTGTITNSGGGLLTLSGTLSKDNSVLRLTGGSFNVTGLITGTTVGTSDLVVDSASVLLSNTNTYAGPTYVYNSGTLTVGVNNAIPNASVVTLGNATTRGTLVIGANSDSISQLVFSGSGGTVSLSGDKTASAQIVTAGSLSLGPNASLMLTNAGTSAGLYRLISATNISGSFSPPNISGASDAYQILTTSTSVDYQQRAVLGTVTVANSAVSIITGGSAAFTYSVANSALFGGATLSFTGTGLSNVAGSSSGSALASGTSTAIAGLVFTGTSVGSGQQGTFTMNSPTAYGATTATGTVSVSVLDHATSSLGALLATSSTISLGTYNYATQTWESGGPQEFFSIYNLASTFGASLTADLSLLGVTGSGNGFSTNLNTYADIAAGNSRRFSVFFDPSGVSSNQSTTFTIAMSDKTGMSGATNTNTLYVTAQVIVVPEPAGLALASIGVVVMGWISCRRRVWP